MSTQLIEHETALAVEDPTIAFVSEEIESLRAEREQLLRQLEEAETRLDLQRRATRILSLPVRETISR